MRRRGKQRRVEEGRDRMGWERREKLHCIRRRGEGWDGIGD